MSTVTPLQLPLERESLSEEVAIARNTSLRAGVLLLVAMLLVGAIGIVALPDPNAQDLGEIFAPPGTSGHLLGTDELGRDVFAWISAGIWVSLGVAIAFSALSAVIGVTVGLCSAYFGGVFDAALMRITDLTLAIPAILVFISASVVLRPNIVVLILLLSSVGWVPYARLVRSVAMVERERSYIAAARLAGATRRRLVGVHLLRSVSTTVLIVGSLQVGYGVLAESALSFVGLGVQPPQTSLGFMLNQGRAVVSEAWWIVVFPGAAIALLALMANLIGDGLRDALQKDVEVTR